MVTLGNYSMCTGLLQFGRSLNIQPSPAQPKGAGKETGLSIERVTSSVRSMVVELSVSLINSLSLSLPPNVTCTTSMFTNRKL